MSTVANVITEIRLELNDTENSRWTDANLLVLIKRAIERMNHVLISNGINFAKSYYSFNTVSGTSTYALPSDFLIQAGLYREDWDQRVTFRSDAEWESITSATQATNWRINGSNIELVGTPTEAVEMHLYYWPSIDTSAYNTATTMPWSGKMDSPIIEYVSLRCKNIDEFDIRNDVQFASDIANNYLSNLAMNEPKASVVRGFYVNSGWEHGEA